MAEDVNDLSLGITWIIRFLLRMFTFILLDVDGDLTADRSRLLSRPLVHSLTAQYCHLVSCVHFLTALLCPHAQVLCALCVSSGVSAQVLCALSVSLVCQHFLSVCVSAQVPCALSMF